MKSKTKTTTFTALARISPLLFLFLLISCRPCVEGEGPVEQETHDVDSFAVIVLNCPADLYISQNYFPEVVTVKAPQNIIDLMEIGVDGNRLVVDSKECFSTKERVEVYVNSKRIEGIEIQGSGDVHTLTDLRGSSLDVKINGSGDFTGEVSYRRLTVNINGSGDVKLSGRANRMEVSINGSGDVKAPNMTCKSTSVNINGSGDAFINAEEYLEATISGSGDVRYTGWPKDSTFVVRGSGRIKPNR